MVRPRKHSRSESLTNILEQVPLHESAGSGSQSPSRLAGERKKASKASGSWAVMEAEEIPQSQGLWNDVVSMRWMIVPSSSGTMLLMSALLYLNYEVVVKIIGPRLGLQVDPENPFRALWFISHKLPFPHSLPGDIRYGKGLKDIIFLLHHIITFSFIRQSITLYVLRPLAKRLGIRGSKILRFQEQGYSMLYYGTMGCWGLYLMRDLPTWYFKTSEFWVGYPHWEMTKQIKSYYLLQFAYWLQQMIILVLKVEKPRKDFAELVVHHLVTLWLIGWSYGINLTMIGNAVFVTMDLSDVFLALAKCVNYSEGPRSSGLGSAVAFAWFVGVWTYLRHYLNFVILWSVWTEFDLIPEYAKVFRPDLGVWLVGWMKWQVFVPIMLIQLLNLFWYYMIWRILIRSIRGVGLADDRSDDEDSGDEGEKETKKSK